MVKFVGIIPAYAGSTTELHCCASHWRDHPRVCGEHIHMGQNRLFTWGSSPRMRGAPRRESSRPYRSGIIPAYAGSTDWRLPVPFS